MSEPTPTVEVSGPSDDSGTKADLTPYRVMAVDGTELLVNLPPDASVYDCCLAVAGMKRLAVSQVRLIAGGEPLVCTRARALREVCGGADLMMVVASSYALGRAVGTLQLGCEATEFEHFPPSAFQDHAEVGSELHLCQGQKVSAFSLVSKLRAGGVAFTGPLLHSEAPDCPPLSGRVLMRIVLHTRSFALGIGAGTASVDVNRDPEHDPAFFGLYHGGSTRNVAARARRTHRASKGDWNHDIKLAVLFDIDQGTMQCYENLEPFGPMFTELPAEPLWPVVVFFGPEDAASIAVDSV